MTRISPNKSVGTISDDFFLSRHLTSTVGLVFFISSRRRHTRFDCDWSSDVCSSDLRRGRAARWRSAVLNGSRSTGSAVTRAGLEGPSVVRELFGMAQGTVKWFNPDKGYRSEERRVGKECRSRWSPYH